MAQYSTITNVCYMYLDRVFLVKRVTRKFSLLNNISECFYMIVYIIIKKKRNVYKLLSIYLKE